MTRRAVGDRPSHLDVVRLGPSDDAHLGACASLMLGSEPWITLQRSAASARLALQDPGKELYAVCEGPDVVAFVLLDMRGPLAGYIQSICVRPQERGRGIGTALIRFAEERILRDSPNVFICVSSFNTDARRLYERLGYQLVGRLAGFIVAPHDELLLRKTRGPWAEFTRR
jgi:ribosomal protein S18 acetylase RimI-like enzyme